MSSQSRILIVGSLPPTPSDAALWTSILALACSAAGLETVVLLDELHAPIDEALSYKTVRPYEDKFIKGAFDDWPRLSVVGGSADSLPVLAMLRRAASAVVISDRSLLKSANVGLHQLGFEAGDLTCWLQEKIGQEGARLGNTLLVHNRMAWNIENEVSAYDYLIPENSTPIALTGLQATELGTSHIANVADFLPATHHGQTPLAPKDNGALIVGLADHLQDDFTELLGEKHEFKVAYRNRFAPDLKEALEKATIVAVLDGANAALCPVVIASLTQQKLLIVANQSWVGALPKGSVLPIQHPEAVVQLANAFLFLRFNHEAANSMRQALVAGTERSPALVDMLRTTANAASPLVRPIVRPAFESTAIQTVVAQSVPSPEGIWSLVGAIPAMPILAALYPDLNVLESNRFLSFAHAKYLANMTDEPLLAIANYLGCENPMINDIHEGVPAAMERKVKPWSSVASGLKRGQKALAFGCNIESVYVPTSTTKTPNAIWSYHFPTDLSDTKEDTKYLDPASGLFWKTDLVQNTISFLLMTGGTGTLGMQVNAEDGLIVSDGTKTEFLSAGAGASFSAPENGIVFFKMTTVPDTSGDLVDVRKTLAGNPLHLKWSPA